MVKFEDYANKYQHIRMERRNGILQIKRLMLDNLGYGLALEGLGVTDYLPWARS